MPALIALVGCLDLLSAVLLVRQFRDLGEPRSLVLAWAYVFSLVVLIGYAAAFPGVVGVQPPFGQNPSTAPWLWVTWHTAFPVMLGVALGPWPRRWTGRVDAARRELLAWTTVIAWVVAGLAVVGVVVRYDKHWPAIIHGLDTSAMTRIAGPVMVPIVAVATALTVWGAFRSRGPERWAALAATTALGDVVLTLVSDFRFSFDWYAGRTLTIVSSAVVLVAMLAELSTVKRRLAEDRERLRQLLTRTHDLERLQHTLLNHMADGVVMEAGDGRVVASNRAAHTLLRMQADQLSSTSTVNAQWRLLGPDGNALPQSETPGRLTLRTETPQRDQIVGVQAANETTRWLSVNTAAVRDAFGAVDYVVSSMSDVTERYAAQLAAGSEARERRERIRDLLDRRALTVVFQPIVELDTSRIVGVEALSRFSGGPARSPDVWFAEAAEVGLGTELELLAVQAALSELDRLPPCAYLSLNVAPMTAAAPQLHELLARVPAERLVLELTEHVGVGNYEELDAALARIRARGVRLAVDDAGSGFASLRHIVNLRPDIIELDLALTRGIQQDPARRALAAALLTFGRDIGAVIVAEGIETQDELATLQSLGISYGQGYFLGRPVPLPQVPPQRGNDSTAALTVGSV